MLRATVAEKDPLIVERVSERFIQLYDYFE